jgi:hypothetical protein
MLRRFTVAALTLLLAATARAQAAATLAVPPDTTRWALEGNAAPADYQGRACLRLDGGAAIVKGFTLRDAVIDVDVATPAARGFLGVQFRVSDDGATSEWIYLRQHRSGYPDAIQYTPVLRTGANWQLYNGPGFTAAVDIPRDQWFHLRIEVTGAQAKLFVKDMTTPALVMDDLKTGVESGNLALYVLTGVTYFSNFTVRRTPDAPWVRHLPPMAPGTLTHWRVSPAYDVLARDLERAPTPAESDTMKWEAIDAEPPGLVVLYRHRDAPHLRVSFANDFSKRLEPQPGTLVVYAKTTIDADRDQLRKLDVGYSDEVSVFLNGKILWRGRSAQYFRDPNFLGIVNAENDAVYLPLRKGRNELVLAVSEIGGGWGYVCRWADGKP